MHAEAATALRDVDDAVDELRHLVDERRELVDHDHERWRSRLGLACLELGQVLRAPLAVQRLAALELRVQRDERALSEVLVEVGDEPDGVRQVDALLERRAALVVDQQEVQAARRMRERERCDEGLQELALPRAGRPGDEAVWPVAPKIDLEQPVAS